MNKELKEELINLYGEQRFYTAYQYIIGFEECIREEMPKGTCQVCDGISSLECELYRRIKEGK